MPFTEGAAPRIYFETDGARTGAPLVLVEGLSAQLIGWRAGFVRRLVDQGFFVIRLDNRDVGLSDQLGSPGQMDAGYTLTDMAGDVCRVLDTLEIEAAHIVGQSLGGAVAQRMALDYGARVRSCTLFYTAPGAGTEFTSSVTHDAAAASPFAPDATREQAVALRVAGEAANGTATYPADRAWLAELAGLSYDRCYRPDGILRQYMALLRAGDWRDELAALRSPVAIIHGRSDAVVKTEAAFELARRIPEAELHLYPGMGHVVVAPLWDDFARIIRRTADRAG